MVDDQSDVGRMAQDILEVAGYAVLRTSDPFEALTLSSQRAGDIDLLLVDVSMPPMDGRELAQRMLVRRPSMKVVLMSGDQVASLAETGGAFIEKPFTIKELLQKVADTLKANSPRNEPLQAREQPRWPRPGAPRDAGVLGLVDP